MNRQVFLSTAGKTMAGIAVVWWLAATAAFASPPAESEARRPNILYIFTDQQFAEAMSCAGNPHVKTPAIDSLAERRVRFAEAYCASPVRSPSRGSVLTGLFPPDAACSPAR